VPEAAGGSALVRPAASNFQLGTLTDVLHKLRILTDRDKLLTVSQLLGRDLAVLRALRVCPRPTWPQRSSPRQGLEKD
jgi:hypothetical protein